MIIQRLEIKYWGHMIMSRSATLSFCKLFLSVQKMHVPSSCSDELYSNIHLRLLYLQFTKGHGNAAGVRNKNYKIPPKICLEVNSLVKKYSAADCAVGKWVSEKWPKSRNETCSLPKMNNNFLVFFEWK